jgi:hypothetical protein
LALGIPAVAVIGSLMFTGQAFAASCAASGSVTQVRNNDLRIYRVGNTVWVCSTRYGHRIRLAQNATYVFTWRRPSRQTFAYAIEKGGGTVGVFGSRNLKTGALLRGHMGPGPFGGVTVDELVARADGSIAYIYSSGPPGDHEYGQAVEKVDTAGWQQLDTACTACGTNISTTYLQIAGATVQWSNSGALRSAPFN